MTNPTYFTVIGDYKAIVADTTNDTDADPDLGVLTATVTFTPMINNGDVLLATQASPRPTGFVPAPITGFIDTDGKLKLRAAANGDYDYTPIRLLADTPLLNLSSPLIYRVSFSNVTYDNRTGSIGSFFFTAPDADTVVNLIDVAPATGQNAVGITHLAPGAVRIEGTDLIFSFGNDDIPDPVSLEGLRGPTGPAATISVGSVTTGAAGSSASVTNTGTSGAAVLAFAIPRGDTGSVGPQGPVGAQGIQGQPGVSLDINGTVATYEDLPSSPAAGDAYVVAADGKLYFYDGTSWPSNGNGVPFVGPQGPVGAQGIQGIQGLRGDTGAVGSTGAAATIAVGTVTTGEPGSSASVTNTGTSGAAVLAFSIPAGNTGSVGPTGPVGATGAAATISIGTVTTGAAGSTASVVNSGTSGAAVFDITIPRGDTGSASSTTWDNIEGKPTYVAAGNTQADARAAIGAGTSNLTLGTTSSTAKAGDYQPAASDITDATTVGRNVLKATDASAARTAIGAGTSSLTLGTTSSTAKAGDYTPTSSEITTALGYTPINPSTKGQANGVASLDSNALVPASLLPSYVDDVLEYANVAAFPATGETGKIYIDASTSKSWRWSGSTYAEIIASPGTTDAVTEGSTNLYFTNARADARISAAIGVSVQAYDSDLTAFAAKTAPTGDVVGTTDSQTLTNKTISGGSNTLSNIAISSLSTTGSASSSTYLRGDGAWSTVSGGTTRSVSTVTTSGTTLGTASGTDYVVFSNIAATTTPTYYVDTVDASTLLQLKGDGTDNSTTIPDSSQYSVALTRYGDTKISATQKYHGTGSIYFDGSGDYLSAAGVGALGSSTFTIEAWIYPTERVSLFPAIFHNYGSFSTGCLGVFVGHNNNSTKYQLAVNSTFPAITSSSSVQYNTWTHIAVVRSAGVVTLYINGTSEGTFSSTATLNGNGLSNAALIGTCGDNVADGYFKGYIDDYRVSANARYTSNFTPTPNTTTNGTLTLPSASSAGSNLYTVSNIHGTDTVQLATTSSQTINGSAPGTLAPGSKLTVISDGSNWRSPW